jgi:aminoglycoside phosphotransferase (APT) family kinase protein
MPPTAERSLNSSWSLHCRRFAYAALMDFGACLPAELHGRTITKVGVGMSGAGVYRVGSAHILKVSPADPVDLWRTKVIVQRAAADAGVAPRVVHADEAQRAVVSEAIADRGFPALSMTPASRETAIDQLGQALRRVHEVPVPAGVAARDPLALFDQFSIDGFPVPPFVTEAIARMRAMAIPPSDRPAGFSHNDVNPSNLAYDGERVVLLDWDTAGVNEPYFDLATVAVFFRLDDAACLALLSAHDGHSVTTLSERFMYDRRLVATLTGTAMLHVARRGGHAGDGSAEALSMAEVYQRMRVGMLSPATPDGQWLYGLALVRTGTEL